jgi:hypothetical protein
MEYGFNEVFLYDEEEMQLLERAGLAFKNAKGNVQLVDNMVAGRHTYPARRHEHRVPTNPPLYFITRCSSNLQVS